MTTIEQYNDIFMKTLSISEDSLNESLVYHSLAVWDSVGHMVLMSAIEEGFSISLDIEDIIDFSSYEKGKEILRKYGVVF